MAGKGQSDIDRLIGQYVQQRQAESGQPMELSGPARAELHAEIEERFGTDLISSQEAAENYAQSLAWQKGISNWWHRMVPWLGFGGACCLALVVAIVSINHGDPGETAPAVSSDFMGDANMERAPAPTTASNVGEGAAAAPAPTAAPVGSAAKSAPAPTIAVPTMPDPAAPIAEEERPDTRPLVAASKTASRSTPKPRPGPKRSEPKTALKVAANESRGRPTLDAATEPASAMRPVGGATGRAMPRISASRKNAAPNPVVVNIPPRPAKTAAQPPPLEAPLQMSKKLSPTISITAAEEGLGGRADNPPMAQAVEPTPIPRPGATTSQRQRVAVSAAPTTPTGPPTRSRVKQKTTYRTSPGYQVIGEQSPAARTTRPVSGQPTVANKRSAGLRGGQPSGLEKFVQVRTRGGFRGSVSDKPEKLILGSFEFLVTGNRVTVRDGDGSIYNGAIDPDSVAGGFRFTVKGRHRSTRQQIEFKGNYTAADNATTKISGDLFVPGRTRQQISAIKQR